MSDSRRNVRIVSRLGALSIGLLTFLAAHTAQAIQLELVIGGLSSPLYVTHSRDGSGRLFIVEQGGVVKVLDPGASEPSVFLNITSRVLSGGEQGLLGLAFHPGFAANRRLFVNYTRQPDGATVVSEFLRSATNPNQANASSERILLTIPQPFANHNGGMIEFGPDGFLYIAVGDGGSGNDPDNHAQNPNDLLGKILRIDVDGAAPYAIPPDNPFAQGGARAEIWAIGFRNPFRFSFDRQTGALIVGDVGQGTREEINVVTRGGNYGWRVLEGTFCTGLGPAACTAPGFFPPVTEYAPHVGGRCAVIGGYVYRGQAGSLPFGRYVFGDHCSGEILDSATTLMLGTGLSISSFGEDQAGELYVVDLTGAVYRLTARAPEPIVEPLVVGAWANFHAAFCYLDANGVFQIQTVEGLLIPTPDKLDVAVLSPSCQTGNLIAIFVTGVSGQSFSWNGIVTYPFK
jgi:glucose/arabinose dehydrogenase